MAGWISCLLAVVQLGFAWICAPAIAATEGGSNSNPEQVILPNGLKVLLVEERSYPVVSAMVWYRVGARNETLGSTGVCHLLEHLLVRRVGTMRPGEVGALIARAGGQFNGYTSDDFTTFFEVLPPARLELALQIEAERMKSANFNDKDVQDEVVNIKGEFESEGKDAVQSLGREIRAAAYQQHPYHNPTMGWQGDVERLNAGYVKYFYERYFRPDNATLVIVGDVKPAAALSLVKKHFNGISKPTSKLATTTSTEPQQKGERRVVVKSSGKQEILEVAYHAPAIPEPDAPALAVMEKLLNAYYSGRLRAKLTDTKICSSAAAKFEAKKDPGLFGITCIAAAGSGEQKILDGLDGALNQLRTEPVSDSELKRARNQAEFAYYSETDGPYRASFHLGYFDSLTGWQNAIVWPAKIRAVSVPDIQRVAKRYFNPDNRIIGWVSSPNAPKAPPVKPDAATDSAPAAEPRKMPHSKQLEHVRMTGYKDDDNAIGPRRRSPELLAQATAQSTPEPTQSAPEPAQSAPEPAQSAPEPAQSAPAPAQSAPASTQSAPEAGQGQPATDPKPAPAAVPTTGAAASDQSGHQPALTPSPPLVPKIHQEAAATLRSVRQKVLSNGLTLVVFESHLSPVVQITGAVKAGGAFDPAGKKGISAVTATVLNYGSAKHTRAQMTAMQEDIGLPPQAMLKFDQGPETIDFQTECLSRDLGTQLSLLGETMSSPGFQDADVDKAKQDVISVIKRQQDSPESKVNRALLRSLISTTSPYCPGDPVERVKSINKFEQADLKDFQEHFINPGSTCLVLAGDVNIDQAAQMAEKALSGWTGKSNRQFPAVQPSSKRVLRTSIPLKDKAQTLLCFGQLIQLPLNHQDYGAFLLADCALINHPIFSRLGQLINNEPQMAAVVGSEALESDVESISNAVQWSVSLSPEPNAVPYVVRTMQNELRSFTKNGVNQQEVSEAKRYLAGAIPVRSMSTIGSVSKNILDSVLQGGDPDYLARIMAGIKTATTESVNKLIRNTFKPDQASLVVAGSGQAITAVRNQVEKQPAKPAGKG